DRRDSRPGQGQPYLPEDAKLASPIHYGRLSKLLWDAIKKLLEDKDRKGGSNLRQDDAPVGVHHAERIYLGEQRHDQYLWRNHDSCHDQPEQESSCRESNTREGISRHTCKYNGDDGDNDGRDGTIYIPAHYTTGTQHLCECV